ncbi:adenomatous polyposis coli protein-like isoform X1 [Lampetra planeri]
MALPSVSYDQLLMQVEALKMENSNLRQELEDNSNHLTKLESEASSMKEVLKQLQSSVKGDTLEMAAAATPEALLDRLKDLEGVCRGGVKLRSKVVLCSNGGGGDGSPLSSRSGDSSPIAGGGGGGSSSSTASAGTTGAGGHKPRSCLNGSRRSAGYLEELEKERSLLLAEIEREEREKDWYYAQLQNLTKRIDGLPLTDGHYLQTDVTRRELELEAQNIRTAMEERLGTCQQMAQRAQVDVLRIKEIDQEIARVRQLLHEAQGVGSDGESSGGQEHDVGSVMSFSSTCSLPRQPASHLGTKVTEDVRVQVEMVYSLLSMLGTHDKDDMSRTLLAMSSSQDSCIAMRQSGCLPLLIQLLHGNNKDSSLLGAAKGNREARARASAALHNIVHSQPDDKRGHREMRVLHLLEQIRAYCEACWEWQDGREAASGGVGATASAIAADVSSVSKPSPVENQIGPAICVLMKLSFDEDHRHAMNELGGLQAIAELLQADCEMFAMTSDQYNVTLRRYAGMALTNLTFGDVANKATLCSMRGCMRGMVAQLKADSEDLRQVIASVLRNLSWRADVTSKKTLREVGSVSALTECALEVKKESTLKSVLSALWNLSAHCTENKADICAVVGALGFLVDTLAYRSQTNTLAIIESGGGILRNVSSLIATNEDYRQILREHNCLQTLLQHLKSHSLTIVSNACGTLWNLSARNARDQEALWDMGAVAMLKNLIHSKHKMIAMGSAAALRNLMANRPAKYKDANILSPDSGMPTLAVRKQRALEAELDAQNLTETFDNIDNLSPKAQHRSKSAHKPQRHGLVSEYVLDGGGGGRKNGVNVCRADAAAGGGGEPAALSPFVNSPLLHGHHHHNLYPKERHHLPADGAKGESPALGAEREPRAADAYRVGGAMEAVPDVSKHSRVAWAIEDAAAAAAGSSASSVDGARSLSSDGRGGGTSYPQPNAPGYGKADGQSRGFQYHYGGVEFKAAHRDGGRAGGKTAHSKGASGKAPSDSAAFEKEKGKYHSYGKYPPDLAQKIHSANHLDENDSETDTPINYSLKYSDEQLNSGRQSPSRGSDVWVRQKQEAESGDKQSAEEKGLAGQFPSYCKRPQYAPQHQAAAQFYPMRPGGGGDGGGGGKREPPVERRINAADCQDDDYEDDKPTNYSERYSEEENQEEEEEAEAAALGGYRMKLPEKGRVRDEPIDYSLKYPAEYGPTGHKLFMGVKKMSAEKESAHVAGKPANVRVGKLAVRDGNAAAGGAGEPGQGLYANRQAASGDKMQTFCLEGTPICFSRCSSLSSLSSADDGMETSHHPPSGKSGSGRADIRIVDLAEDGAGAGEEESPEPSPAARRAKAARHHGEGAHHKTVDFSGAKSPSKSGSQTPKSPLDHYVQETPLVFSRCSSVSSLDSYPDSSIASSIQSDPVSGTVSGVISPSELPDSPGQTMPPSRSKTPPPPRLRSERPDDEDEGREGPGEGGAKPDGGRQPWRGKADAGAQGTQSRDSLLHFETEATPDGFSCASSLSALSMDEPPIAKDAELRGAALAAVVEEAAAEAASPEAAQNSATPAERARRSRRAEESGSAEALEDSEDDSNILEECINSAMPTKSTAAKQKKDAAAAPSHKASGAKGRTVAAAPKKPSQLPLYQARGGTRLPVQAPKHVSFTSEIFNRDVPNVYCTEGTPINFSTATSLSDLTFDSPPNEASGEVGAGGDAAEQRDAVPTEGRSNDEEEGGRAAAGTPGAGGAKPSENDILAECISSAMPKGKSHKPHRVKKIMDQMQQGPAAGGESAKSKLPSLRSAAQGRLLLQPTPASDSLETYRTEGTPVNFSAATSLGDLTADDTAERRDGGEAAPAPARRLPARHEARGGGHRGPPAAAAREERPRPGFSSDSPLHFTPIEGTPYCFSRNDSLSSLDFEDDETDLAGDKAGLETDGAATDAPAGGARGPGKKSGEASAVGRGGGYHKGPKSSGPPAAKGVHKPAAIPEEGQKPGTKLPKGLPKLVPTSQLPRAEKNADKRGSGLEEQVQRFAVEDTPVSFSRNSSLSSLSDIDRDNNNRGGARTAGGGEGGGATERPPARAKAAEPSAYAPRAFRVEDTPVCFSRNSSLSSLSVDSEDDLLQECISSAMPQRRKQQRTRKAEAKEQGAAGDDGGAPPDPSVRRLRARGQEAAVRDHGPGTVEPERDDGGAAENREGGVPVERFDSPGSEKIGSPDSESFDWKAIQEGANSIVSSLNQAAACLSRRASSDSDSILSLVSGLSLGSPLHMTPEHENKSLSGGRGGGPRIVKAAEKGGGEWRKGDEEVAPKAVKGGKKVYRSGITGKARPSSDSAVPCLSRPAQPPAAVVPIVTRGRATAPSPGLRNPSPTASPAPKKPVAKTPVGSKSPASARAPAGTSRSISAPARSDMSSAARPSLSLGPVTPKAVGSRLEQLASARSLQSPARKSLSPGRASMSPGRNSFPSGRNGVRGAAAGGRSGQTSAGTSSPNAPSSRSSSSGNLACLPTSGNLSCLPSSRSLGSSTPPRQITPPKAGGAAAAGSRVDGNGAAGRPEPAGARGSPGAKMVAQTSGRSGGIPAKRAELARMSSTRSSESESERSDKPALVRQSTFIKETPSPDLRKKLKESASCESVSGLPELSPNSERGLEGRGGGAGGAEERAGNGARARPSRSQSRSPTRVPTGRSGTWKREGSKHSSSLPRVGTWRRVGSSSSILSASSESSDKTRSEDVKPRQGAAVFKALGGGGAKGHPPNGGKGRPDKLHPNAQAGQAATEKRSNALQSGQRLTTDRASKTGPVHGTGISDGPSGGESGHRSRGTWRKLRDAADVSASPPPPQQQNVDAHANHEPALRMAPAVSKTEDVWVRIEDCPINNPRSSKSASGSDGAATSPDKTSQSGLDDFSEGGTCSRDASTLSLNHEADGGGDAERERERPPSAGQQSPELESQPTLSEKTPFSSNSSSKHSSPSGAVSVRVTPFNYVPSPRKSSADAGSGAVVVGGGAGGGGVVVVAAARPSQIPTPVVGKRHEEPKAEGGGGGGDADDANTKLHSGSYLVTSV